ncbi:hypothetical protein, partial [Shinella zoogloeoides]|uniref:hypothetical protein n=1 Tax=Shinella zoogloeoides TaxID=352475 RepID=UPI0019CF9724
VEEKSCFDIFVSKAREKSSFDIKYVDIQKYTGDVEKVISYTFKFDKFARGSVDIGSTFSIFPKRK